MSLFAHWSANLDKADEDGTSPLAAAIVAGKAEAAAALVAAGASVNAPNRLGGEGPLFLAAKLGQLSLLRQMLATGTANLDQQTSYGQTAVYAATLHRVSVT